MVAPLSEPAGWSSNSSDAPTGKTGGMHHGMGGNTEVYEMEENAPGAVRSKYVGTEADQRDMSQLGKVQELRVGVSSSVVHVETLLT